MAKFCNKCGKALVDGICPDCSKKEEVKEEQTTTSNLGTVSYTHLRAHET